MPDIYSEYSDERVKQLMELSKKEFPHMQEYLIFGILILKVRVDDELYLKCNYTEAKIRYLLYHHDLIK